MTTLGDLLADLTSGDAERAEAAAVALPQYRDAALPQLHKLIGTQNIEGRWWATRALAGFPQTEAGELLSAGLQDPETSIRYCAALVLSKRPHAPAIPELIKILSNSDPLFARLAGDALVAVGGEAVEPIITTLESLAPTAQVEAVRALALIGDPRAISALFKLVDSDSPTLEHWVSEGLERMGVGMRFFEP